MNQRRGYRSDNPLADLLSRLERTDPAAYRELEMRYTEAFLAIRQDGVESFDDNTDVDVEEELWLLRNDLVKLLGS